MGFIIAARRNYDTRTTEPRYLTVDSTKNTLKLLNERKGTISTSAPNYRQKITVEHYLGYQPYIEVYFMLNGENFYRKAPSLHVDKNLFRIKHSVSIQRNDNNKFDVYFESGDSANGGENATFEYIIRTYINAWEESWYE